MHKGASAIADRAGGPSDLSRCASQPDGAHPLRLTEADFRLADEINRRVRMAPRTIRLFEGARWTVYLMARSTEQDWRLLGLSLPSRLWFYSSGNYGRHLYIFLPFARRLCITRFARPINRKGPELACEGAASAIEAATAGETRSGSTEGESAVPKGDAQ